MGSLGTPKSDYVMCARPLISICRVKIQNLPQICIPTIAILAFTVLMVVAIIPYGLKMGWKSVLAGNRLDAIRSISNQTDFVLVCFA